MATFSRCGLHEIVASAREYAKQRTTALRMASPHQSAHLLPLLELQPAQLKHGLCEAILAWLCSDTCLSFCANDNIKRSLGVHMQFWL